MNSNNAADRLEHVRRECAGRWPEDPNAPAPPLTVEQQLADLQAHLEDLRPAVRAIVFDLKATQRERNALISILHRLGWTTQLTTTGVIVRDSKGNQFGGYGDEYV